MSKLAEFTISAARPLPVILLADVSGSMAADGKIDALNVAVTEMIAAFAQEDSAQAEIHVAVIAFGAEARMHQGLAAA
ncbi:MAG: tellurite resistance protein TerY, partial [Chloroflexia bacterium]|nr:tellurite resistance protein TerY [Chloroflexia bacterium]